MLEKISSLSFWIGKRGYENPNNQIYCEDTLLHACYKQNFQKQHQAEIGKKSSKSLATGKKSNKS